MKTEKNKKNNPAAAVSKLSLVKENRSYTDAGTSPLTEDYTLSEKIIKFIGVDIPEKISFSKAIGAYGTFTATNNLQKFSRAKIFNEAGKVTKLFARFSMLGGENGNADTERNLKEFSLRFFTEDGNWDIAGNNTPVLFSNDFKKYNEFFQLQKRDVRTNLKNPTKTWDFLSTHPESLHHLMMVMSDRGTPCGYKYMNGYGVHTFSMINEANEKVWVKFHFKTLQGIKTFTREEAALTCADDMDYAQRDLVQSIDRGKNPKWILSLQIMTNEEAKEFYFNPFDVTKTWPQKKFPLIEAGIIELNQIPENYYNEVEQINFSLTNIIDGISYSPDKMLQSRLQACSAIDEPIQYKQNELKKIGNHTTAYMPYNFKDIYIHKKYEEDTATNLPAGEYFSTPESWYDYNTSNENDHYTQPGILFKKVMPETERANMIENIIISMSGINGPDTEMIVKRQLYHWFKVDEKLGTAIADGLSINTESILSKK